MSLISVSNLHADQKKIGFIYIGPPGDHGWTYMHDQGRIYMENELGDSISTTYIENVPENEIKLVELKAGQVSLHHPRIVHGSGVNRSNDRRIGFVIQSYIGTNVKQTSGRNGVQLARGVDKFKHHEHLGRVKSLMSKDGMVLRKKENEFLQEIFYKGSSKKSEF